MNEDETNDTQSSIGRRKMRKLSDPSSSHSAVSKKNKKMDSNQSVLRVLKGLLTRRFYIRYSTQLLCCVVILFPLSCIYMGYILGLRLAPSSFSRRFPDADVVVDTSRLNYSHYRSHNVTLTFIGGLGNQMFQYASLYGIAKANGLLPVIDEDSVLSRMFRSTLRAAKRDESHTSRSYSLFVERRSNAFDQRTLSLNFMRNIQLDGYFQSWRYFDHIQRDIRQQFAFRATIYREVNDLLHAARSRHLEKASAAAASDVRFVGVHIRRGDMLDMINVEKGYTTADVEYLEKAVRYFEKKYPEVVFIVCSDDMEWSRENFRVNTGSVVLSEYSSEPFHDLCLLSLCNDSIITVGTFGWWGAWLAGGQTIYYRQYPKLGSTLRDNFKMGDYYLPNWIAMS